MDALKKLFLAAVGGTSLTYENASDALNKLVEKGQISVDEGKVLSQDLKRFVQDHRGQAGVTEPAEQQNSLTDLQEQVSKLADQVAILSDKVAIIEDKDHDFNEDNF
ncbi:phasin family protein [Aerococcus kribbianus]|uniref:Uncharacterized protein n=1 Tax=Aerococcus kribbianus TaxID=2999064 RepID=A0A9X3FN78_9LACT|nr:MULTISPECIES: hypothetical protein [unclassified Aerococcus]MCZ0716716.1 hypothetical protein [Aerococcus sp. YH-aer221]MCZ0725004.1 hypothetical protein [Aerococcus sp. YH-aer222]